MTMITLKETKVYKPFMYDDLLIKNIALQELLGFGRVREVALRNDEVGRLSDQDVEFRRQADELASKFPVLDLKGRSAEEGFLPWDSYMVVDHIPIPVFDTTQRGGTYGCSYRRNSFQIRHPQVNELMAADSDCGSVDWVNTPPEWAILAFDNKPCRHNCLAMQMDKGTQSAFKDKLTDDEILKMSTAQRRTWGLPYISQIREDINLEWVAGIPMFPSTALELAGRVRKISPEAEFMLLFMPEWEYKEIELPKLDPVLIVWQPIGKGRSNGIWLKVAEWGRDVMELENG